MGKECTTKPQEHERGRLGCNFSAAWQIVTQGGRPMYLHYGGLLSVLFIICHSIILQFVTFFHNSCPEYHFNEVWCICLHFLSALKKVPLISSNDRLVGYFWAWVCLFEFSFKLLYCYFVICSLQIEHFYCMFLSYVLALHKTWTHSAQFEWIITLFIKSGKSYLWS